MSCPLPADYTPLHPSSHHHYAIHHHTYLYTIITPHHTYINCSMLFQMLFHLRFQQPTLCQQTTHHHATPSLPHHHTYLFTIITPHPVTPHHTTSPSTTPCCSRRCFISSASDILSFSNKLHTITPITHYTIITPPLHHSSLLNAYLYTVITPHLVITSQHIYINYYMLLQTMLLCLQKTTHHHTKPWHHHTHTYTTLVTSHCITSHPSFL